MLRRFSLKDKLKRINRENIKKHRRLLIFFAIVLLLSLLICIPLYLTSLPSYYVGYKNIKSYYKTWRVSTHAEVGCTQCHVKPVNREIAIFRAKMVGEFYLRFILNSNKPRIFNKPVNTSCLECHSGTRTASPSGDLLIPHRAHVDILKMDCIDCHSWVVHRKNPEGNHRPRMITCLSCHNGKRASNKCEDCHKKKSFPVSHRAQDWLIIHNEKTEEVDCKQCHGWIPDYCQDCHQKKPVSHAGRWRTFHRLKVAKHRNCETCHKDPFCIRCHGEVP